MPKLNTKKKWSSTTLPSFKGQVGTNLKKIRTEFGITQTALSKAIGVGSYQISGYEAGKDIISIYIAVKICTVLATTIDVLVKDTE